MENTVQLEMLGKTVKVNGIFTNSQARITGVTINDDKSLSYIGRYTVVPADPNAVGMEIAFDASDIAEVL